MNVLPFNEPNKLVQSLYRQAYQVPVSGFKSKCFELLAETFNVDSGTWITRCERESPFYEQDSFTYNLPAGFMEDYHALSTVSTQVHQVFGFMMANLGKTMDILDVVPEEEWFGSDMYKLYCEKFNLHHSLMTVTANPVNQAINVVTFARHDPAHAFTEEEKQLKEFLVPNLIEAMRVNMLNAFHKGGKEQAYRAVFDRYGHLVEAEDGFLTLSERFDLWQDPDQKQKFKVDLKPQAGEVKTDDYEVEFENHHGLVFVELLATHGLSAMSDKKRVVCQYLVLGKSNKEIAKAMHISPNTVNNHLKTIYKALGVNSRHQATAYLMRQNLV